jgi:RimJ/RimL family protein N-acetyltransferase
MPPLVAPVVPAGSMARDEQPSLSAVRSLRLRPWLARDAPALVQAFSDPDIRRWHVNVVDNHEEALEWIASWGRRWHAETDACWAVIDEASGKLLGRVALRGIDLCDGIAECSYWVLPEARGRAVAVEATSRMANWALYELGIHRLTIVHSLANDRSCRVAQKAAFPLEGTMTSQQLLVDGWHDTHLHARTS